MRSMSCWPPNSAPCTSAEKHAASATMQSASQEPLLTRTGSLLRFWEYVKQEGHNVTRAHLEQNLEAKLHDA